MITTAPIDDLLNGLDPSSAAWLLEWRDDLVEPIEDEIASAHIASAVAALRADRPVAVLPRRRTARRLTKVAVGASASFVAMTGLAAASVLPAPAARGFVYVAEALGVPVPQSITKSAEGNHEELAVVAPADLPAADAGDATATPQADALPTETIPTPAPTPSTAPVAAVTATTVLAPADPVMPSAAPCATPAPGSSSKAADGTPAASATTTTAPASEEPAAEVCAPADGTSAEGSEDGTATAGGSEDGSATASGSEGGGETTTTTSPPATEPPTTAPAESPPPTSAPEDGVASAESDPGATTP